MKTVLLAIIVASISGCATTALEREPCFSPEWELSKAQADMAKALPAAKYRQLTGAERTRFLGVYNNEPPVGGFLYDTIGVFDDPAAPRVLVVLMERGCVWNALPVPRDAFIEAIKGGKES